MTQRRASTGKRSVSILLAVAMLLTLMPMPVFGASEDLRASVWPQANDRGYLTEVSHYQTITGDTYEAFQILLNKAPKWLNTTSGNYEDVVSFQVESCIDVTQTVDGSVEDLINGTSAEARKWNVAYDTDSVTAIIYLYYTGGEIADGEYEFAFNSSASGLCYFNDLGNPVSGYSADVDFILDRSKPEVVEVEDLSNAGTIELVYHFSQDVELDDAEFNLSAYIAVFDGEGADVTDRFEGEYDTAARTLTVKASGLSKDKYTVSLNSDAVFNEAGNPCVPVSDQVIWYGAVDFTAEIRYEDQSGTLPSIFVTFSSDPRFVVTGSPLTEGDLENHDIVTLRDMSTGQKVACDYSIEGRTVNLIPKSDLEEGRWYQVEISSGVVEDTTGAAIGAVVFDAFQIHKEMEAPSVYPPSGSVLTGETVYELILNFREDIYGWAGNAITSTTAAQGITVYQGSADITSGLVVHYNGSGVITVKHANGAAFSDGSYRIETKTGHFRDLYLNSFPAVSAAFTVKQNAFTLSVSLKAGIYQDLAAVGLSFSKQPYTNMYLTQAYAAHVQNAIKVTDQSGAVHTTSVAGTGTGMDFLMDLSGLPTGTYTLTVLENRLFDHLGNPLETQEIVFTVDKDAPEISGGSPAWGSTVHHVPSQLVVHFSEGMMYDQIAIRDLPQSILKQVVSVNGLNADQYFVRAANSRSMVITFADGAVNRGTALRAVFTGLTDYAGNELDGNEYILFISEEPAEPAAPADVTVSFSPSGVLGPASASNAVEIVVNRELYYEGYQLGYADTKTMLRFLITMYNESGIQQKFDDFIIREEKGVTTITAIPDEPFTGGAYVVTLRGDLLRDEHGEQLEVYNHYFSADLDGPTAFLMPGNNTVIAGNVTEIHAYFSEAVYNANGQVPTDSEVLSALSMRVSVDKDNPLTTGQPYSGISRAYYVPGENKAVYVLGTALADDIYHAELAAGAFQDQAGNSSDSAVSVFTVHSGDAAVTFEPRSGALLNTGTPDMSVTFSQTVVDSKTYQIIDDAQEWQEIVKLLDNSGAVVAHASVTGVVYAGGKTSVTLGLDSGTSLANGSYLLSVTEGALVLASNNQTPVAGTVAAFTVSQGQPGIVIYPGESSVVGSLDFAKVSFDTIVKNSDGNNATRADLAKVITWKTSGGADIAFTLNTGVENGNTVVYLLPNAPLADDTYTVTVAGGTLQDAAGNSLRRTASTFRLSQNDETAITITPSNGSVVNGSPLSMRVEYSREVVDAKTLLEVTEEGWKSILTLKDAANGQAVPFEVISATYWGEKTIVELSANLPDGIYVLTAAEGKLSLKDNTAFSAPGAASYFRVKAVGPYAEITPANGSIVSSLDHIGILFSNTMYDSDGNLANASLLKSAITLEQGAAAVDFTLTMKHLDGRTYAALTPNSVLADGLYTVTVDGSSLYDVAKNALTSETSTFTLNRSTTATIVFTPQHGSKVNDNEPQMVVRFSQAVLDANTRSRIYNTDVWSEIVTVTDVNGAKVPGVSVAKVEYPNVGQEMEITLEGALSDGFYKLAVADGRLVLENNPAHLVAGDFAIFSVTVTGPHAEIAPADGSVVGSLDFVKVTFDKEMKNQYGNPVTKAELEDAITWETVTGPVTTGSAIRFTLEMGTENGGTVAYLVPNAPLSDGVYTVTVAGGTLQDDAENLLGAVSSTFTLDRDDKVTVALTPSNNSVVNDSQLTMRVEYSREVVDAKTLLEVTEEGWKSILTLKDAANGQAVPFEVISATYWGEKTIVELSANLPDGIYVLTAAEGKLSLKDNTAFSAPGAASYFRVKAVGPWAEITPANGSIVSSLDHIGILFSDTMYDSDGNLANASHLKSAITLEQGAAAVDFTLTMEHLDGRTYAALTPNSVLADGLYTVTVDGSSLYDVAKNALTSETSAFTLNRSTTATIVFTPQHGSKVNDNEPQMVVRFSQAVLDANTRSRIYNTDVWSEIVTVTDMNGAKVPGVSVAKVEYPNVGQEMEITLEGALTDGFYKLAVADGRLVLENNPAHLVAGDFAIFSVTVTGPHAEIAPVDGSVVGSLDFVKVTFDKEMKNQYGNPVTKAELEGAITWETITGPVTTGSAIRFTLEMGTENGGTVAYLVPNAPLSDGVYTVTVAGGTLQDDAENLLGAVSSTFTLDRDDKVTVALTPSNNSVVNDSQLTMRVEYSREVVDAKTLLEVMEEGWKSILTLKDAANGQAVPFEVISATYWGEKTIIELTAYLTDGAYVLTAAEGKLVLKDNTAFSAPGAASYFRMKAVGPWAEIDPADGSILSSLEQAVVRFSEVMYDQNGNPAAKPLFEQAIRFQTEGGAAVPYTLTLQDGNMTAVLTPTASGVLADGNYTITVKGGLLYDSSGNELNKTSSTFTLNQKGMADVIFYPSDGAKLNAGHDYSSWTPRIVFNGQIKEAASNNLFDDSPSSLLALNRLVKVYKYDTVLSQYTAANNIQVEAISYVDQTTVIFLTGGQWSDGRYKVEFGDNAFKTSNGDPIAANSSQFSIDTVRPFFIDSAPAIQEGLTKDSVFWYKSSELLYNSLTGSLITESDVKSHVKLVKTGTDSVTVDYTATVVHNTDHSYTEIALQPKQSLLNGSYEVVFESTGALADSHGNWLDEDNYGYVVAENTPVMNVVYVKDGQEYTLNHSRHTLLFNSEIIVTFSEQVIKANGTAILSSDITNLFHFEETVSGRDIIFTGEVKGDGSIVIKTVSSLTDGEYKLTLKEDAVKSQASGNSVPEQSVQFIVKEFIPSVEITPANGAYVSNLDSVKAVFSSYMTEYAGSGQHKLLTADYLQQVVKLYRNGQEISYEAQYNTSSQTLIMTPAFGGIAFSDGLYTIVFQPDALCDEDGNLLKAVTSRFTVDNTAPGVSFEPKDGAVVPMNQKKILITINEPVYRGGVILTALPEDQLESLVEVKLDGATYGMYTVEVSLYGSQNEQLQIILTCVEDDGLYPAGTYSVTFLGQNVADKAGNKGKTEKATFEIKEMPFTVFAPESGAVITDAQQEITVTFSETPYVVKEENRVRMTADDAALFLTVEKDGAEFTAYEITVSEEGKLVITPESQDGWEDGAYELKIKGDVLWDNSGTFQFAANEAAYTVAVLQGPKVQFTPAGGTYEDFLTAAEAHLSEAVTTADGTAVTDAKATEIVKVSVNGAALDPAENKYSVTYSGTGNRFNINMTVLAEELKLGDTVTILIPEGSVKSAANGLPQAKDASVTYTYGIKAASVTISGGSSVNVGKTLKLSATVKPDDAADKSVTWTSSNLQMATVAGDGTVTGVSKGSVTITATAVSDPTVYATHTVTVSTSGGDGGGSGGGTGGGGTGGGGDTVKLLIECVDENEKVIHTEEKNVTVGERVTVKAPKVNGYTLDDDESKTVLIASKNNKVTFQYATSDKTGSSPSDLVLYTDEHIRYLFGYEDGTIAPDKTITRAEAASMIYTLVDMKDKNDSFASGFSDVSRSAWYHQQVTYLAHYGVLTGYTDGTFRPEAPITRAEFVTMMSQFEGAAGGRVSFSDVDSSHWAYKFIANGVSKGWIGGYEDGTFKPDDSITRAESVRVVNSMLGRKVHVDDVPQSISTYTDLSRSHWAFADVMEASTKHDYTKASNGYEIWTLRD